MNTSSSINNLQEMEIELTSFDQYLYRIIHNWSKVLSALIFTLVPLFLFLDLFTVPGNLIMRFIFYRAFPTAIAIIQFIMLTRTKPGKWSYINGYIAAIIVGLSISLMTADLGGFDSRYYAGLNLIIIAVSLFLPWQSMHSAIIGLLVIFIYIGTDLIAGHPFDSSNMVSNLFFMFATVIISVSINHVKHLLIKNEFSLMTQLKAARDTIWGEMEIAKKIQTSLLPDKTSLGNYHINATMVPAAEVGGDYYDIINTRSDEHWLAIGDVSGHGVESGLIMMMAQTSIYSLTNSNLDMLPSSVIKHVNTVIRNNIQRLNSNLYMTLQVIRLMDNHIRVAGKHQDIMIYRARNQSVDIIPTQGTWVGLTDFIDHMMIDHTVEIFPGDILLLFTDGITEAENNRGEMYGYDRLAEALKNNASESVEEIIQNLLSEVTAWLEKQDDDITLVAVKKVL